MKKQSYIQVRNWLKQYKLIEKELKSRLEYAEDFKKILINPIVEEESKLKRIYTSVISHMEKEARRLRQRLDDMERVVNKLSGEERSVIYHRYIMGISWLDMPDYLMYEQRTCQIFEVNALKRILKMNIDLESEKDEG